MSTADILRIFVVVLGGAVIFSTILVIYSYTRLLHHQQPDGPRFLPHHIGAIGAAFIILAVFGMVEVGLRVGDPLSWRTPMLFVAFSLANIAQALMLSIVRAQGRSDT